MRIAFISFEYPNNLYSGGIGTYVQQASNILAERGHDITVFTCGRQTSSVTDNGVKIIEIEDFDRFDFAISAAQAFLPIHKEHPFDVIEGPDFNADGRKVKNIFPSLPYVLRMHTPTKLATIKDSSQGIFKEVVKIKNDLLSLLNYKVLKRQNSIQFQSTFKYYHSYVQDRIERREGLKADVVVCPSLEMKNYALVKWNIKRDKIIHSPNPYVPSRKFLAIPESQKKDNLCVGFIGRVSYFKGMDMLAKTIPRVLKNNIDITFRFVGPIYKEQNTNQLYDEWLKRKLPSFKNNIEFTGKLELSAIPEELSKMDIVIVPSVFDNFPTVCLEAMSAARPVIGTRSGGMEEMISHEKNGILINYGDHKNLARQILKLSTNKELRERLGNNARKSILDRYNSERIGKELESICLKAMQFAKENKS